MIIIFGWHVDMDRVKIVRICSPLFGDFFFIYREEKNSTERLLLRDAWYPLQMYEIFFKSVTIQAFIFQDTAIFMFFRP